MRISVDQQELYVTIPRHLESYRRMRRESLSLAAQHFANSPTARTGIRERIAMLYSRQFDEDIDAEMIRNMELIA